jgi:hypothetical protein
MIWEHAMGHNVGPHGKPTGIAFYGSEGVLLADFGGWEVIPESSSKLTGKDGDPHRYFKREYKGPGVPPRPGNAGAARGIHVRNFLDCMRSRKRPNADVEVCHNTMMLCHLGNIAQRVGRKVLWDSAAHRIKDDPAAQALVGREYRKPWSLPVS